MLQKIQVHNNDVCTELGHLKKKLPINWIPINCQLPFQAYWLPEVARKEDLITLMKQNELNETGSCF
jgi:hypothetical protein